MSTRHPIRYDRSLLSDDDIYLFNEGNHFRLYRHLGAHPEEDVVHFAVWAPNADAVAVKGDFNGWSSQSHPLRPRGDSGIWFGTIEGLQAGANYKYFVHSRNGYYADKADPFAFASTVPPNTASVVGDLSYTWGDREWMSNRAACNSLRAPMSVYEVHLGSWQRVPEQGNRSLSYRELAVALVNHVKTLGFTHVEFLPVMEHPFFGSWGYQTTGYFCPTSRYGSPQDLMYLIDQFHQSGIGVLLDWVPSHFPGDEFGLAYFDGTHLFEHADPRQGFHPDWKSYIFNYSRREVQAFLISSAQFWLDLYHADGLRVDAVASMLYLDYSRPEGQWVPNIYGGRENLEAISLLRRMNETVYLNYPDVQMIAEESTSWPGVSRPTHLGGLGFGLKWDMGWMHDSLTYIQRDPVHRKYHQGQLTFRMLYAFNENFMLPLSHDEVVHGKGSLLSKMPGDPWQKFANLRLLYGYMYTQPGKKLLFMGDEFGQWKEWQHDTSLDWDLWQHSTHGGLARWLGDLNHFYRTEPAMHFNDCDPHGFRWLEANDYERSVIAYLRSGPPGTKPVLVVCNFTPAVWQNYRVGVPGKGVWKEVLNSDAAAYGGSGQGNLGQVATVPVSYQGQPASLVLTLPPLAVVLLQSVVSS